MILVYSRIADAGDGGEHSRAVDLLLGLLAVGGALHYELWEVDLPRSDVTLYGWNHWRQTNREGGVTDHTILGGPVGKVGVVKPNLPLLP